MADTRVNGWSNYWTWKANVEFEETIDTLVAEGKYERYEPTEIADQLKEAIEGYLTEGVSCELAQHWLTCAVEEVNFREIVMSQLRDDEDWDNDLHRWKR